MNQYLKSALAASAIGTALVTSAVAQERISIGAGGTGGLFYVIGAGIADLINKYMPDATARAEVTGASVENIRRVAAGQLTMGLSSSSTLFEAYVGEGPFADGAQPIAGMAYLYPAVLQVATTAQTGISGFSDLEGKRVNLGPPGSNAAVLAQRLLEAYDVFDPARAQFLSYSEGVSALMNGTIDATVVLAGAPTAALIDLDAQRDMVLLSLDVERTVPLFEQYPYYQPYEIAAGTYPDVSAPVRVINDPATLFVHQDADPAMVEALSAAIFVHLDELAEVHPQARAIRLETAVDLPIPLHPGAQSYFDAN